MYAGLACARPWPRPVTRRVDRQQTTVKVPNHHDEEQRGAIGRADQQSTHVSGLSTRPEPGACGGALAPYVGRRPLHTNETTASAIIPCVQVVGETASQARDRSVRALLQAKPPAF